MLDEIKDVNDFYSKSEKDYDNGELEDETENDDLDENGIENDESGSGSGELTSESSLEKSTTLSEDHNSCRRQNDPISYEFNSERDATKIEYE
ncbi:unnamed protein product [Phytomonas sp. Hart1]|nr:unnamed protein product [Phytomonas sp. Hart1]|eukprot:CCW68229.1 unnamed protein product [Phytomonas sp. isolate Hart1]